MKSCETIRSCLEEYRYDAMTAPERLQVEAHLLECARCRTVLERIQGLEELLGSLAETEEPSPEQVKAGVDGIQRRLNRTGRLKEVIPMAAAASALLGVFVWLIAGALPSGTPGAQEPKGIFEERRLGTVENAPEGTPVVWSPDGKAWAYRAKAGGKMVMIVGGQRGEEFDHVGNPFFSPDGKKVAYVAHIAGPPGKFFVVAGNQRGEEFSAIFAPKADGHGGLRKPSMTVDWSPDGRAVVYAGESARGIHLVVGEKKSEPYKSIDEVVWSPDGRSVAFTARLGDDAFVVVGEKKGEVFDSVRDLVFSPDGSTVGYAAREGGKYYVVVGARKLPSFAVVGRPVFSPDGRAVACAVGTDPQKAVMTSIAINGVIDTRYGAGVGGLIVSLGDPVFSPDGKRIAYKAAGTWIVVDGQREKESFDSVGDPIFSPDGTTVAYEATKGTKHLVVMGDRVGEKFSRVGHVQFSPDSKSVAYRAERFGKQFVAAGEALSEGFEEVSDGPFYSPDSKRVAFVIRNGNELWSKVMEVK